MTKHIHDAANLFPMMEGDEFAELVADIKANGLREPIWLHPDGAIVDGRNRYRACRAAKVEPRFRTWAGEGSVVSFVLSANLHRRHLTASQRGVAAARAKPLYEAEAKARQGTRTDLSANWRGSPGKASESVAKDFKVSPRTVERASAVLGEGSPGLIEKVEKGEVTVHKALQEVWPEEPRRKRTIEERARDMCKYDGDPLWNFCNALITINALPIDPVEYARTIPKLNAPTADAHMEPALKKLQAFANERRQIISNTITLKKDSKEEQNDETA